MGCWTRSKFAIVAFTLQLLFLILFGIYGKYELQAPADTATPSNGTMTKPDDMKRWLYPMFQDIHVMIFIGFGFLMTFLRRYGYAAVGVNFLIAALAIQWHILFKGLISKGAVEIGIMNLITADFCAAAILISFGAVIGKTSPLQLMIMSFMEVMVYAVNEHIAEYFYEVADIGGSMIIHVFGAYFGLALSRVIHKPHFIGSPHEGPSYQSDIFSMIGTVFLWLYWPSFNAGPALSHDAQLRSVVNTYLSLAACVLVTFALSSLMDKTGRFHMVHVQNSTLAGGVAIGTAANFMVKPWGAVLVGSIAAVISVVGYSTIQPFLAKRLGLHDSCGVNNLHGMPGLFAAIVGAVAAAAINPAEYGTDLGNVFSAVNKGHRTASEQGAYQAATLGTTLALALAGGAVTGLFLRFIPGLGEPSKEELFSDNKIFEVPDDFLSTYSEVSSLKNPVSPTTSNGAENGEHITHDTKI